MLEVHVTYVYELRAEKLCHVLVQHDFPLSPRQAAELIWSRFVNVHGLPGKNIPLDLHQEHLNRVIQISIKGLGANKTEKTITTIGKALGVFGPVIGNFDIENEVGHVSGQALKKI